MKDFRGKVAVITGAGSGIGRALALRLADEGAVLAVSDIDQAAIAETARDCAARGASATGYRLDVADRAAVAAHADAVAAEVGTPNLVVNNAGVAVAANILDVGWDDFDWIMGINFWGVAHGTKAFLPQLIASGDGHLVNVSSVFGLISVPGQGTYNASKFAVRGLTEAVRQEMLAGRHPVGVSCVHPGGIKTNIARSARMADGVDRDTAARLFDRIARTSPDAAAAAILRGVRRRRPRILIGADARVIDLAQRVTGAGYQRATALGGAAALPKGKR